MYAEVEFVCLGGDDDDDDGGAQRLRIRELFGLSRLSLHYHPTDRPIALQMQRRGAMMMDHRKRIGMSSKAARPRRSDFPSRPLRKQQATQQKWWGQ